MQNNNLPERPFYYRKHRPHDCRRANFHDYKAPGVYMISISKGAGCLPFSAISAMKKEGTEIPFVQLSNLGQIIDFQIRSIEDWEFFRILNYIIMPDHIHILWQVKDRLKYDLGHYVGLFKTRCTTNFRRSGLCESTATSPSVFSDNFNDKIGFDTPLIKRFSNYITDNPRRRYIAINRPELFIRVQRIRIGNKELDVYGNFQLLRHPIIAPAIVSSRYSEEQKRYYEWQWGEAIRTKGVLISPFISEAERDLMNRGIEEGASVIRIIPDGLPPKYKPHGREFDLCAEGRCLHIGPARDSKARHQVTRNECLSYNDLARWIASHPAETMTLINAARRP